MLKGRVRLQFRPRAVVCKPHGSLDWYHRDGKPVRFSGELKGHNRLIITPGTTKFRGGYESPFDRQREKANSAIDRATRFLVLGYGFNDDHLETHLTPAIRGGKPALLITRTLTENAKNLALQNPNIIAIDKAPGGGTRVIRDAVAGVYPTLNIWDLGDFIEEVLEP